MCLTSGGIEYHSPCVFTGIDVVYCHLWSCSVLLKYLSVPPLREGAANCLHEIVSKGKWTNVSIALRATV